MALGAEESLELLLQGEVAILGREGREATVIAYELTAAAALGRGSVSFVLVWSLRKPGVSTRPNLQQSGKSSRVLDRDRLVREAAHCFPSRTQMPPPHSPELLNEALGSLCQRLSLPLLSQLRAGSMRDCCNNMSS